MIVDIIFVSKPLRNRMIVIMYNILHVHVWSDAKTGFILIICNMEFFILFTALYWSTYSNKQIFITIILLRYEWIMLFSAIDRVKRKVAIVRINEIIIRNYFPKSISYEFYHRSYSIRYY